MEKLVTSSSSSPFNEIALGGLIAQIEAIHKSHPARVRVISRRICAVSETGRRKRPSLTSRPAVMQADRRTDRHNAGQEAFLALNALDPVCPFRVSDLSLHIRPGRIALISAPSSAIIRIVQYYVQRRFA